MQREHAAFGLEVSELQASIPCNHPQAPMAYQAIHTTLDGEQRVCATRDH